MPSTFRAIAIDYDGTLAVGHPDEAVLAAISELRHSGMRVILCTGRILDDLRDLLPDVEQRFDAVVAENGAVIASASGVRVTAPPVSTELEAALRRRNVPLRRGRVLLDTYADYDHIVLEEVARLGLDCQIVRNRQALMITPAGITKGSGLVDVLGDLGVSRHSAIGIGDAENDHALLDACEIGVAVANAVPSLRAHADLVLAEPNGTGVAGFLRGPVLRNELAAHTGHARIEIGRFTDGSPASVPASGISILVHGEPGTGKSWLAGLLAERLIEAGYSVSSSIPKATTYPSKAVRCARYRRAPPTGSRTPPAAHPAPLHQRHCRPFQISAAEKREYYLDASERLSRLRSETGLPHWIFLDEADQLLHGDDIAHTDDQARVGFCLTTHRPDALNAGTLAAINVRISRDRERLAADATSDDDVADLTLHDKPVSALLETDGRATVFTAARRICPHLRHWHKYLNQGVPPERRFYFRSSGRSAGNLAEFHRELRRAEPATLARHLDNSDFSRWIRDVLRETRLAQSVANTESRFRDDQDAAAARLHILDAIRLLHTDT